MTFKQFTKLIKTILINYATFKRTKRALVPEYRLTYNNLFNYLLLSIIEYNYNYIQLYIT